MTLPILGSHSLSGISRLWDSIKSKVSLSNKSTKVGDVSCVKSMTSGGKAKGRFVLWQNKEEKKLQVAEKKSAIPEINVTVKNGNVSCSSKYTPLSITPQGTYYGSCFGSKKQLSNALEVKVISERQSGAQTKEIIEELGFVRTSSTRGNEQATKDLIMYALTLTYDLNEWDPYYPIESNLSNIQLMTPGKSSDHNIPLAQMEALQELAKQKQPIEIKYNEKTFKVKINPPLLFNFGVNAQHFRLGRLACSKEIDEINQKSFALLFGDDPRNIGTGRFCKEGSVIGKFLNDCKDKTKKQQIQALAEQIISILKKYPDGMESDPYALPARVILLSRLLGLEVSFNCKSGKDRTSVCMLVIESMIQYYNIYSEFPAPMDPGEEYKEIFRLHYLSGEAARVVNANVEKEKLDIKEYRFFNPFQKLYGITLSEDYLVNALEYLKGNLPQGLEDKEVASWLEIAKKKPKDLTDEDRKAMQNASIKLEKLKKELKENLEEKSEEQSMVIEGILVSLNRFSPESPKNSQPKGSSKPPQFPMTPDMLAGVKLKHLEQSK